MILNGPLRDRIAKLGKAISQEGDIGISWAALRAAEESVEASKEMMSLGYRKEKYDEAALIEELGDLVLRVELLIEAAVIDRKSIRARILAKVKKYEKYKALGRNLV